MLNRKFQAFQVSVWIRDNKSYAKQKKKHVVVRTGKFCSPPIL